MCEWRVYNYRNHKLSHSPSSFTFPPNVWPVKLILVIRICCVYIYSSQILITVSSLFNPHFYHILSVALNFHLQ
jgi:hypothetical protein